MAEDKFMWKVYGGQFVPAGFKWGLPVYHVITHNVCAELLSPLVFDIKVCYSLLTLLVITWYIGQIPIYVSKAFGPYRSPMETAAEILQIVRQRQKLKTLSAIQEQEDKTLLSAIPNEPSNLLGGDLSTDEYLYDLKLRTYIRNIQTGNRLMKKTTLPKLSVDDSTTFISEQGETSLAEKIKASRMNGSSGTISQNGSYRSISRSDSIRRQIHNKNRVRDFSRSVSTQTRISCLRVNNSAISAMDSLTVLQEFQIGLLDEDIESEIFISEIHTIRKFLNNSIMGKLSEDVEQYYYVEERSANTDYDPVFMPLCRVTVFSEDVKIKSALHETHCRNSTPDCEVCMKYFDDLYKKYKFVLPRIDSRWPKGHRYHTKPIHNDITNVPYHVYDTESKETEGKTSRNDTIFRKDLSRNDTKSSNNLKVNSPAKFVQSPVQRYRNKHLSAIQTTDNININYRRAKPKNNSFRKSYTTKL